jgi:hypothetical protein
MVGVEMRDHHHVDRGVVYAISPGTTRAELVARMREAQRSVVQDIWARRSPDLPLRNPDELMVLASIVGQNGATPEQRPRVAALLINRLKAKMKLQSDAAVVYGLVGGTGSLGRPIQRSELTAPTPYNTYVIDGLPPGPISNPSRAYRPRASASALRAGDDGHRDAPIVGRDMPTPNPIKPIQCGRIHVDIPVDMGSAAPSW